MSEKLNISGGTIPDKILQLGEWNTSNLNFFARFDGPYLQREVAIGNHALRKIMKKNFEYMSRNLFFISSFGRFLLSEAKIGSVLEAEQIAHKTIQNAMDAVQRRVGQAEALLSAHGQHEEMQNSKLQNLLVPMTTPGARKYVELLVEADKFYNLNALLWISGEIDDKTKFENESNVRKEVQGCIRGITNQFGFILNKTREKSPEEAAKIGGHNEKQLGDDAVEAVNVLGQAMSESQPVETTEATTKVKKPKAAAAEAA